MDARAGRKVHELQRHLVHPSCMYSEEITAAELGLLARGGDVQALATLLEQCRPSLYGIAIRLLGNRADALDAIQDTSVVALVRLRELRDPGAARAWLHGVVRNVCLMRIRQRREVVLEGDGLERAAPGPDEALDQVVMREGSGR